MTHRIRTILRYGNYALVTLILVLSALFSQLTLQRTLYKFETETFETLELPEASLIRAASLNHHTLAADVAWIASIVNYGESKRTSRSYESLIDNGMVITRVDPRFRRPYDWFPNVAMTRENSPSEERLEEINTLIKRGMEFFPNDGSLPYSAAMNYIGQGGQISEERRLRETNRAIELLEKAVQRDETPPSATFVLQWFKKRRARLQGDEPESGKSDARLLARVLLSVEDEETRKRIRQQLERIQEESEIASQSLLYERKLEDAEKHSPFSFLPTDLWIVTAFP